MSKAKLQTLKSLRRTVQKVWKQYGGVGGGMAELLRRIDLRIKKEE